MSEFMLVLCARIVCRCGRNLAFCWTEEAISMILARDAGKWCGKHDCALCVLLLSVWDTTLMRCFWD